MKYESSYLNDTGMLPYLYTEWHSVLHLDSCSWFLLCSCQWQSCIFYVWTDHSHHPCNCQLELETTWSITWNMFADESNHAMCTLSIIIKCTNMDQNYLKEPKFLKHTYITEWGEYHEMKRWQTKKPLIKLRNAILKKTTSELDYSDPYFVHRHT